jgi:hypothetical protein
MPAGSIPSIRMEKLFASVILSAALVSQGCSSAPKREAGFVDAFPIFPTEQPLTAAERLQTERDCHALGKKGLPQTRNEFESQFDYSVFYSPKMNACLVAKYTVWKNGGEYVEIADSGTGSQVWLEFYSTPRPKPEIEKILSEQIEDLK